jgi:hypothetical protein
MESYESNKRQIRNVLFISLFISFTGIILTFLLTANFVNLSTSDGIRTGTIVKLSQKGMIWRTWEGQLMIGSVTSGEIWDFSLDDWDINTKQLAKELSDYQSKMTPVNLKYHQARYVWPWRAGTNYLVFEVIPITK